MTTARSRGHAGRATAMAAGAAALLLGASASAEVPRSGALQGSDWISAAADIAVEGFGRPAGPWELDLPADHGVHPEARTELWQLSAHLSDAEGRPVGVQFLLFRIGLAEPEAPPPGSAWEARALYRGHVVLVGAGDAGVVAEERFGRGMPGLAGFDPNLAELRLDNWSLDLPAGEEPGPWTLAASAGDARISLTLDPGKAPLAVDGEATPFRGYAFSRLRAEGGIATPAGPVQVSGAAWFEHLWGDLPIPGGTPVASDRLQVQLDDGSELSVVRTRRRDGTGVPTVDAVLIDAQGGAVTFAEAAARMEPARLWQGDTAAWPVDWRLRLGDLQLAVTPVADAQEHAFMVRTWSGLVEVEGRRGDRPVSGLGTLQLTGYGD